MSSSTRIVSDLDELRWQAVASRSTGGDVFYYGVRRFIYGLATHVDSDQMIEGAVDTFLATGRQLFKPPAATARKAR